LLALLDGGDLSAVAVYGEALQEEEQIQEPHAFAVAVPYAWRALTVHRVRDGDDFE